MIPRKLKNFLAYINGEDYGGRVPEVELPKLTRKMVEYYAGGMAGPIDIDMGAEKLEGSITLAEFSVAAMKHFARSDVAAIPIRITGAVVSDSGTSGTDAIAIVMRGRWKEIELGTFKRGDDHTVKFAYTLSAFEFYVNDEEIIFIDHPNNIYRIGGVDMLAAENAALRG